MTYSLPKEKKKGGVGGGKVFLGKGDCHLIVEHKQTITQTDKSMPFGNEFKETNGCEAAKNVNCTNLSLNLGEEAFA